MKSAMWIGAIAIVVGGASCDRNAGAPTETTGGDAGAPGRTTETMGAPIERNGTLGGGAMRDERMVGPTGGMDAAVAPTDRTGVATTRGDVGFPLAGKTMGDASAGVRQDMDGGVRQDMDGGARQDMDGGVRQDMDGGARRRARGDDDAGCSGR